MQRESLLGQLSKTRHRLRRRLQAHGRRHRIPYQRPAVQGHSVQREPSPLSRRRRSQQWANRPLHGGGSRSSGLATPRPLRFRTCVSITVVDTSEWSCSSSPSFMARRPFCFSTLRLRFGVISVLAASSWRRRPFASAPDVKVAVPYGFWAGSWGRLSECIPAALEIPTSMYF